ncbi:MAG: DUF4388 domain-containing protein [Candidatus Binatia bacterium]
MQGNLRQIGLNDLLSLATNGKKSGVLKLARGKETVEVYFTGGVIVHATCPVGEGEKALLYPVTWTDGTLSLDPDGTAAATTIQKSSAELLTEIESMTQEWRTILDVIPSSKAVFRLADLHDDQAGPITVPHVGWRVLSKLDGIRTIEEIADLLRIPFAYVAKVIFSLHKSGLVESAAPAAKPVVDLVPQALLTRVTDILMEIIGPMAPLVLRDQLRSLGVTANSLPEAKLDDLIVLLGLEIGDSKLKKKFEATMYQEMANYKRL